MLSVVLLPLAFVSSLFSALALLPILLAGPGDQGEEPQAGEADRQG